MDPQLPWWVYLAPVLSAVVGGAIALIGVFVGPWVRARSEQEQWQRERRLDSYADLARIAHNLSDALSRWRRSGQHDFDSVRQEVRQAAYDMARAVSRVELVAAPPVRDASLRLLNFTVEAIDPLMGLGLSEWEDKQQQLHVARAGLGDKYNGFMTAARHDLGIR